MYRFILINLRNVGVHYAAPYIKHAAYSMLYTIYDPYRPKLLNFKIKV